MSFGNRGFNQKGSAVRTVYRLLKLNHLIRNPRLKLASIALAHAVGLRHLVVRLDPVVACNLRCTMCYFSDKQYVRTHKGIFSSDEIARIAALLFPRALLVVVGCGAEPTLYKDFPEIVRLAKQHAVPNVSMVTNAQLLTEKHIEHLVDYGLDEIMISVHGTTRETYERFMAGASFEKLHAVLQTLRDVKSRRRSLFPRLRINYTVNSENIDELTALFDVFGDYDLSTLQIRPVMDLGGQYRDPIGTAELAKFRAVTAALGREAHVRGVTYLANVGDPTYTQPASSAVFQAVNRGISPEKVWREDFNWRNETYEDYCIRTRWIRKLISAAITGRDEIDTSDIGFGKYAARYDVNL
jgi:molybdenum cofactor biosynthesis enzyme MoaA